MKKMIIMVIILSSALSHLQKIKASDKKIEIYGSTRDSKSRFEQSKKYISDDFSNLMQEKSEAKRVDILAKNPSLDLFYKAQNDGLLTLGNKTFNWDDFKILNQEQQRNFIKICNQDPYYSCCVGTSNKLFCRHICSLKCCCGCEEESYFNMLKSMPKHIKEDLIVNTTEDGVCVMYCPTLIPGSALSSLILFCTEGCTLANAAGLMVAGTFGIGIVIAQRIRQNFCNEKYYVDLD